MSFYSAAHYRRVSPRADTAADIADRIHRNWAAEQAKRDRATRFPDLTVDNVDAAIEFQDERYRFWLKQQEQGR